MVWHSHVGHPGPHGWREQRDKAREEEGESWPSEGSSLELCSWQYSGQDHSTLGQITQVLQQPIPVTFLSLLSLPQPDTAPPSVYGSLPLTFSVLG
jgi:hypothetical protein